MNLQKQKGQIALIVLLISAVAMTVGLSVSRKTTTETKIDIDEELLKQAFNTAESGVDYYLGTGQTQYQTSDTKSQANITVQSIGENKKTLDSNGTVLPNNQSLFWLVNHNENGSIGTTYYETNSLNDICADTGFKKALKIDYFYLDIDSKYKVIRKGYNFNSAEPTVTGFENVTSNCIHDFALTGQPLLLTITPIGTNSKLSISGASNFPSQGIEITSLGQAGDISNAVKRQIKVANRYKIPSFMLEAITANGNITSE